MVPAQMSVQELLRLMRVRRTQFAIAVDEYGGTDGIVTLENVLEEIAASCRTSRGALGDRRAPPGRHRAHRRRGERGRPRRAAQHRVEPGPYKTVAGLLLEHFREIPEVGDTADLGGYRFAVVEMDDLRIAAVEARELGADAAPEAPGTVRWDLPRRPKRPSPEAGARTPQSGLLRVGDPAAGDPLLVRGGGIDVLDDHDLHPGARRGVRNRWRGAARPGGDRVHARIAGLRGRGAADRALDGHARRARGDPHRIRARVRGAARDLPGGGAVAGRRRLGRRQHRAHDGLSGALQLAGDALVQRAPPDGAGHAHDRLRYRRRRGAAALDDRGALGLVGGDGDQRAADPARQRAARAAADPRVGRPTSDCGWNG